MRALILFLSLSLSGACHPTGQTATTTASTEHHNPVAEAESSTQPMSVERLDFLLRKIDPKIEREQNAWQFSLQGRTLYLVSDPDADRMRLMTPIADSKVLTESLMLRLLQANYDSALDARYAVANEFIWGVFIHPLSALTKEELASAIAQVFSVAGNFGTSFSSGALLYGGGDSQAENEKLLEQLHKQLSPTI